MKRDLAIAVVLSFALHFGTLVMFAIQAKPSAPVVEAAEQEQITIIEITLPEDPPELVQLQEEDMPSDTPQAETEPMQVAALPEPPSSIDTTAIADKVVIQPPVAPRPDAIAGAFVPTNRQRGSGPGGAGGDISNVFELRDLDRQPQFRSRPPPQYPFELRRAGISGQAEIWMRVDEQGNVAEARVMSATHPEFGRAALDSVRRWRWTPGTKNGRPVQFQFIAPVAFNMGDN